ncbi:uncharacterized protein A4U43_C07F25900 [Asparagus officinalis]|uniref:Large ribosomal subunit protein uL23m n=1 Tax=Asparagus officinalis TaxID=4686 RepID=A0A5P1EEV8_ASPOF|nr:uncharacterized protein LOC109850290 [Asparagus officinalis]ONK64435.1 uncharacterized protein A4U43_C07F25900 [Asparagus officinalis]
MGSRLGRRVVHFPNLPLKLLLPNPPFDSIREFALKTIPSASKIEIRRILESLYGFEIDDVRTLNMEGKKKKRGGFLAAKPDYKKAYITLKNPLSISPELFPIPWVTESMKEKVGKRAKPAVVEEGGEDEAGRVRTPKHWLGDPVREEGRRGDKTRGVGWRRGDQRGKGKEGEEEEKSRFPWSSMRSWRR